MILAISVPCWLIPLLTGLISAFLAYWLGKSGGDEWKNRATNLQADLDACKKERIKLESDLKIASTVSKDSDNSSSEINSLKAELLQWKDKASDLETQVSALQSASTSASSNDVTSSFAAGNNTSELEGKVSALESELQQWKSKASSLENQVSALQSAASSSASSSNTSELENKIANLEDELAKSKARETLLAEKLKNTESAKSNSSASSFTSGAVAGAVSFNADAAKAALGKKIKQDDLTIVEGIGPKIQGLFHNHGVKTWVALSQCSIEKCQEVLDSGGSRYRMHNPSTWPKQASFAAEGKWAELKKWQDELDGGR